MDAEARADALGAHRRGPPEPPAHGGTVEALPGGQGQAATLHVNGGTVAGLLAGGCARCRQQQGRVLVDEQGQPALDLAGDGLAPVNSGYIRGEFKVIVGRLGGN